MCTSIHTAILSKIEYGVYKEYIGVLSKIILYLLQDGCTCMHACMHAFIHDYIHTHTYIHTCMHVCMHAYLHTYSIIHTESAKPASTHTYLQHTYLHTYVRRHEHVRMHAYIRYQRGVHIAWCTYVYIYICTNVQPNTCTIAYAYLKGYVCVYVHTHKCICTHLLVCIYVCTCICTEHTRGEFESEYCRIPMPVLGANYTLSLRNGMATLNNISHGRKIASCSLLITQIEKQIDRYSLFFVLYPGFDS